MVRYYVQPSTPGAGQDRQPRAEIICELTGGAEEATQCLISSADGDRVDAVAADLSPVDSSPTTGEGLYSLLVDGKSYQVYVERAQVRSGEGTYDQGLCITIGRHQFNLPVLTEREWRLMKVAPKAHIASGPVEVKSPMPGLVKAIHVSPGDDVRLGDRLLVLEAMKMENEITAPRDGRVAHISVQQGTVVEGGKLLLTLEDVMGDG